MAPSNQPTGQGMLSMALRDKASLYNAYMAFVKNGGVFLPTGSNYRLGDQVFLLLTLMDEPERLPVVGKVVWVTPRGAQNNRPAGIGLQFTEKDGGTVRNKIETYLAGALESERATHTM